jgi:hypothetical protein
MRTVSRGVRLSEPDISSDWVLVKIQHALEIHQLRSRRVRQAKKTGVLALPHYCHDNAATIKGSRPCPKRWPDVEHRMSLADHDRSPECVLARQEFRGLRGGIHAPR